MSASPCPEDQDALTLLAAEHASIDLLFAAIGDASTDDARASLAARICQVLTVHAAIEEELLYPAASRALMDDRLVQRAEVEHASIKEIVRRVEPLAPSDPRFAPTLKVLEEYVQHHAREEERGLFPRLLGSPLDLEALGGALAARRRQLAVVLTTPDPRIGRTPAGAGAPIDAHAAKPAAPRPAPRARAATDLRGRSVRP